MPYKYRKLRGRIVEKFGCIRNFSKEVGLSTVNISRKLNGKSGFSQSDMDAWAKLLDIELSEYGVYFFT